jgi:hypothetical protein
MGAQSGDYFCLASQSTCAVFSRARRGFVASLAHPARLGSVALQHVGETLLVASGTEDGVVHFHSGAVVQGDEHAPTFAKADGLHTALVAKGKVVASLALRDGVCLAGAATGAVAVIRVPSQYVNPIL